MALITRGYRGSRAVILSAEKGHRYDVYDANCKKLEYCIWCDTLTGEAVHVCFDEEGLVHRVVDDRGHIAARTEWRQHSAPLITFKISDYSR